MAEQSKGGTCGNSTVRDNQRRRSDVGLGADMGAISPRPAVADARRGAGDPMGLPAGGKACG